MQDGRNFVFSVIFGHKEFTDKWWAERHPGQNSRVVVYGEEMTRKQQQSTYFQSNRLVKLLGRQKMSGAAMNTVC